eukprot:m.37240 g.37240  ORF g.37240 m.37240 type:complete len:391 (+) comp9788_c0_seq1:70-1242(+)
MGELREAPTALLMSVATIGLVWHALGELRRGSDLLRLSGLDYFESLGVFCSLKEMFVLVLGLSRREASHSKFKVFTRLVAEGLLLTLRGMHFGVGAVALLTLLMASLSFYLLLAPIRAFLHLPAPQQTRILAMVGAVGTLLLLVQITTRVMAPEMLTSALLILSYLAATQEYSLEKYLGLGTPPPTPMPSPTTSRSRGASSLQLPLDLSNTNPNEIRSAQLMRMLVHSPLLAPMKNTREFPSALLSRLRFETFSAGSVLFQIGDPGHHMLFLLNGKLLGTAANSRTFVIETGATLGEVALLNSGRRRTATIAALTSCEILLLDRAGFDQLRSLFPDLALAVRSQVMTTLCKDHHAHVVRSFRTTASTALAAAAACACVLLLLAMLAASIL